MAGLFVNFSNDGLWRIDNRCVQVLFAIAALLFVLVTLSTGAWAQNVPQSVEPGHLERRFEQPKVPKSVEEPIIRVPGDQTSPPKEAASTMFDLSGIVVDGSTVYQPNDFLPLYESILGKTVSLAHIFEIANAITAKYRADGYILSQAVVPAQRIRDGLVTIRVVEGFIDKISIEGNRRDFRDLIGTYGEKIISSRPLHIEALERYLLLANDLPGHEVHSVLRPSKDISGAADLTLIVDYKPVRASLSIDNRGSEYTGPNEGSVVVQGNSLAGLGERTQVSYILAPKDNDGDGEELRFFDIYHEETVGAEGTQIRFRASRGLSHPGGALEDQDIVGSSSSFTLSVSHPLIRSRQQNLQVGLEFSIRNSQTKLLGDELSDDKLRAVRLSGTYDVIDPWGGVSLLSAGLSQGLEIMGSSRSGASNLSRSDGKPDFFKINADASRLQKITNNLNVFVALTGQMAASDLLAAEEFSVGGSQFGRGYDSSETTGNDGFATKVEVQWTEHPDFFGLRDYQFYVFHDFGAVWKVHPTDTDTLSSAGAGVRFNITDFLSGYLEYAQPLTRPVSARSSDGKSDDHRIFFSMTVRM